MQDFRDADGPPPVDGVAVGYLTAVPAAMVELLDVITAASHAAQRRLSPCQDA